MSARSLWSPLDFGRQGRSSCAAKVSPSAESALERRYVGTKARRSIAMETDMQDAERSGDSEVAEHFRRRPGRKDAEQAKRLLAQPLPG